MRRYRRRHRNGFIVYRRSENHDWIINNRKWRCVETIKVACIVVELIPSSKEFHSSGKVPIKFFLRIFFLSFFNKFSACFHSWKTFNWMEIFSQEVLCQNLADFGSCKSSFFIRLLHQTFLSDISMKLLQDSSSKFPIKLYQN